jgi:hypothetical protein
MPTTRDRVPSHTREDINEQIQRDIEKNVRHFARHPAQVPKRMRELDEEWDIERAIEANAAALALTGVVLGATRNRSWLMLPALVTGFLLQHAIQGW